MIKILILNIDKSECFEKKNHKCTTKFDVCTYILKCIKWMCGKIATDGQWKNENLAFFVAAQLMH